MNVEQVQDLVGKPYALGARGPDAYDCWGLCIEVYRRMGIALPSYDACTRAGARVQVCEHARDLVDWIDAPQDWCFVYCIRHGHIGLYVQARVMHSARKLGVVVQRLDQFKVIYPKIMFARWI